jgi:hypothetical protein
MSQVLQVVVPDGVFAAIQRQAQAQGTDPGSVATTALTEQFGSTPASAEANAEAAFRSLFGSVKLGHPTGLDNQQIDADLAREYSRGL